jgi:hypothetical protein
MKSIEADTMTLTLTNADWLQNESAPRMPCIQIQIDSPEEILIERLRAPDGEVYEPENVDVFYRHQAVEPPIESGVLSLADRLTGEYILEIPTSPHLIEKLVYAVRQYGKRREVVPQFKIQIQTKERQLASFSKDTLLIYGADDVLLQERSLIPSGIET